MKRMNKLMFVVAIMAVLSLNNTAKAQDSATADKVSFTAGADIYSSYVWRGTKFAGPSIQPTVAMDAGIFTLGVWGSYGTVVPGGSPYYENRPLPFL